MLECAVSHAAMSRLPSLPRRQIPGRRQQMVGGLSLRDLISVAYRCVSPAHVEGGAANSEAQPSKTPRAGEPMDGAAAPLGFSLGRVQRAHVTAEDAYW